jgi:mRNA interferase MazF
MGSFAIGTVVLIPFPYADFSKFKKRPALVVGFADFNNLILCQITSKSDASMKAIPLDDNEFINGGLSLKSYIRPDKLFTVERSIAEAQLGLLNQSKSETVRTQIRELFKDE